MRIISQDKMKDISYEHSNFIIREESHKIENPSEVSRYSIREVNDYLILGSYKTLDKAKEVMREMRTYYHNLMHYNMLFMKDKDDEQLSPLFEMPQDEGEEEE